eukprot:SAG31_NODE_29844_length_389_cov_0.627586_1_plen_75_part_10
MKLTTTRPALLTGEADIVSDVALAQTESTDDSAIQPAVKQKRKKQDQKQSKKRNQKKKNDNGGADDEGKTVGNPL